MFSLLDIFKGVALHFALWRHVSRRNDEGSRRSSKRAWNGNGRSVSDGDWRSDGG